MGEGRGGSPRLGRWEKEEDLGLGLGGTPKILGGLWGGFWEWGGVPEV